VFGAKTDPGLRQGRLARNDFSKFNRTSLRKSGSHFSSGFALNSLAFQKQLP
jgi:hypothetical protein